MEARKIKNPPKGGSKKGTSSLSLNSKIMKLIKITGTKLGNFIKAIVVGNDQAQEMEERLRKIKEKQRSNFNNQFPLF